LGAFEELDWLPQPWGFYNLLSGPDSELQVESRTVSGSIVSQRERLVWKRPGQADGEMTRLVVYKVRGGRIHQLWYYPVEPDPAWVPEVPDPSFPQGEGPTVWVDAAHLNGHTPDGTYWPFAELLRRDGYRVRTWEAAFTPGVLDSVEVLVIANAHPRDGGWRRPIASAFAPGEAEVLTDWVANGGALLLITDHMPSPGAAMELGRAFGVEFHDGIVQDTTVRGPDLFRRTDGTLRPHLITNGSSLAERVDSVATHSGQAFRPLTGAEDVIEPILVLPETAILLEPEVWREIDEDTPRRPVGGWLQAAVRQYGEGRVALFGEAGMFRILTPYTNLHGYAENAQLIRNLMRWLTQQQRSD
jgi:hypothetical protein